AAAELFFSSHLKDDLNESIIKEIRRQKENIILIGMPGSGKTVIGRALAGLTGRKCWDIDEYISSSQGRSIEDIFAQKGESYFRHLEREAVSLLAKESGRIITTGGGVVLDRANYAPLRQNGRIYYIERAIDQLSMDGRPLSLDLAHLLLMEKQRKPLYRGFYDVIIENNGFIEAAAEKIWSDFYENIGD
ncbi:MAG: shikimate kinase, partial [Clostridiales bacterium]